MKINELKAGVVLSGLTVVLSSVISIIYTPFMLSILGQSEYGVYTLASSVVANLGVLNLGFSSAYIKFYAEYKAKNDEDAVARLNGMYLTVFVVIGLIALIAGGILTANTDKIFDKSLTESEIKTTVTLMKILVVNIAISFPTSFFTSFITANEKYIFCKLTSMLKMVCSPLLNLPILLMGFGSVGMVVTTLIVNIISDSINIWYSVKKIKIKFNFRKFDFSLLKRVWVFSFYIFLNLITNQINWNVGKFMLGIFQSAAAVAIFGVAEHINNMYINIFRMVSNVFIPRVNHMVARGDSDDTITDLFIKVGRIQFIVLALIFIAFLFFGRYFISIWAGSEYSEAYLVVLILIGSVTIEGIQTIGIDVQRAKDLHKFRSILYIIGALVNIIITIPLCIKYSTVGAVCGTALSLLLYNGLIMNIYYHKKVGINIIRFWKSILSIFPAFAIPVIYGIMVNKFFEITSFLKFVVQGGIMCILYALSMYFIGMNDYERSLVINPIKKILSKKAE